jgi:uroporphyrin-III C-methyltransferase/precorrin-2 dehydrogenase/sirohydrochlorin ferrochelatase
VVSGHAESAFGPVLDGLEPHAATIVVLMGLESRARVAARLLARGWDPDTPVAVLIAASTPASSTWTGTLDALGRREPVLDSDDAGTIVIGEVVNVGRQLAHEEPAADKALAR